MLLLFFDRREIFLKCISGKGVDAADFLQIKGCETVVLELPDAHSLENGIESI